MNKNSDELSKKYSEEIMQYYNMQKKNKSVPTPAPDYEIKYLEPELPDYISMSVRNSTDISQGTSMENNSRNIMSDDFIMRDTTGRYMDLPEPEDISKIMTRKPLGPGHVISPGEPLEPGPVIPPDETSGPGPVIRPDTPDNLLNSNYGKLRVEVKSANRAVPIEDALVVITKQSVTGNELLSIMLTNPNGETRTVAIPAPAKEISETPSDPTPFAKVNVNTYKKGFYEVENSDIPIFAGVTSIQPVNMIPLPFQDHTQKLVFPEREPDL